MWLQSIALSSAKVMKQVESRGQKAATNDLHRNLHNLIAGINLEKKQVILDKVAKTSAPILSEFDARCLSNLIYSFGLVEYIPKNEDGRTRSLGYSCPRARGDVQVAAFLSLKAYPTCSGRMCKDGVIKLVAIQSSSR